MTAPVRLRGEGGGRSHPGMNDRRRTFDHLRITERIDAIVAHVREEEGREQAKLLDEIARLRAENERLRGDGKRLETGPYRPAPDDWTGVFIRGDNAGGYAQDLIRFISGSHDPLTKARVCELVELLQSCDERKLRMLAAGAGAGECSDGD